MNYLEIEEMLDNGGQVDPLMESAFHSQQQQGRQNVQSLSAVRTQGRNSQADSYWSGNAPVLVKVIVPFLYI